MLVLIYDKTISSILEGIRSIEKHAGENLVPIRLEVQRCIVTIVDGLDMKQGDVPANIARLCLFVTENTIGDSLESWKASLKVMQAVREGFSGIQEEARELEYRGEIPSLDMAGI